MSTSTQALFNPTPNASPDLGAFSPRPQEDSKLVSLIRSPSMKGYFDPKAAESQSGLLTPFASTSNAMPPWANALDREGLSRNVLLSIDPQIIAHSLSRFHCSVLHKVPDNLTAEFVLGSLMDSGEASGTSHSQSTAPPAFAALFGSDDRPHWLTKLVLMQVLVNDTSTSTSSYPISNPNPQVASPGRRSEDRGAQTSRTHSRSEVISTWVRIGEYCRVNGDECSWRAIMHALRRDGKRALEANWSPGWRLRTVESGNPGWRAMGKGIDSPGGGIRKVIQDELTKASGKTGEIFSIDSIVKAQLLFERFRTSFSLCPRKVSLSDDEVGDEVRKLVEYWSDLYADAGNSGLAAKFQKYVPFISVILSKLIRRIYVRIDQFMSLSLAAEPRRKGLYEPFFWSKSSSNPQPGSSLIPLLFPEPLPTVTLIDRSQLLRGRVDSDATDIQYLRAVDGHLRPDERPASQQRSEASSSPFSSYPSSMVNYYLSFKTLWSTPHQTLDLRLWYDLDHRAGTLIFPGMPEKHVVGRAPSIRVKPGSSRGLDRKSSVARRSSLPSLSQRQPIVVSETSADPPLRVLVQSGTLDRLVDILVHGLNNVSVSVADDNGEMSLREGSRELMLDHKEFSRVWWNVFRSFVAPLIFFELLRKSYIRAQPQGSEPTVEDYVDVLTSREKVIETIR
ncbi:hypothetical protein MPER_11335, partial [Moniliophthora perniciosa FA553]